MNQAKELSKSVSVLWILSGIFSRKNVNSWWMYYSQKWNVGTSLDWMLKTKRQMVSAVLDTWENIGVLRTITFPDI